MKLSINLCLKDITPKNETQFHLQLKKNRELLSKHSLNELTKPYKINITINLIVIYCISYERLGREDRTTI